MREFEADLVQSLWYARCSANDSMDKEQPKFKSTGEEQAPLEVSPEGRLAQANQLSEKRRAALIEAQKMARAELARRRRRLGELTPEQEIALENLLMSAVTKVSGVAERAIESLQAVAFKTSLQHSHEDKTAAV